MGKHRFSNKMKRVLFCALFAIGLAGCDEKPLHTVSTQNPTYDVELLFTVNGCEVYRFQDDGYSRYLTTCTGSVSGGAGMVGKIPVPDTVTTTVRP